MSKVQESKPAEGEENIEIQRIEIEPAENGFIYKVCSGSDTNYKEEKEVFEDLDGVINAVQDDLESPHMRGGKPPLGSGQRFAQLKNKLAAKGASNPAGLAAYIGRKKFGKEKFQSLAAKGKKLHGSIFKS